MAILMGFGPLAWAWRIRGLILLDILDAVGWLVVVGMEVVMVVFG